MIEEPDPYRCYAHLPYVRLEQPGEPALGPGRLVSLDFATWNRLDDSYPYAEWAFGRSRPLFYARELVAEGVLAPSTPEGQVAVIMDPDLGGQLEERLFVPFDQEAAMVHQSLLLATRARLPSPRLSVRYVERLGQVVRHVGPFDREAIVYAENASYPLDGEEVGRAEQAHRLLTATDLVRAIPVVKAGLSTLEWAGRPEVSPLNDFLHCVIALEALLMADVTRGLTETFARRGAALLANDREGLDETHRLLKTVYAVRSEALHGRDYVAAIARSGQPGETFLMLGRMLLGHALMRTLAILRDREQDPSPIRTLRRDLEAGWDDDEVLARIREGWDR
jgi:hypothetical protein